MRGRDWQLQDVKSHFSKIVRRAEVGETTVVARHGKKTAVVMSYRHYLELTRAHKTLLEALKSAPPMDDLPVERSRELVRPVELE